MTHFAKPLGRKGTSPRFWTFMLIALPLLGLTDPSSAEVVTLYDGVEQAVKPQDFDPQYLGFVDIGAGGDTYDNGRQATHLNTSALEAQRGGYLNYDLEGNLINDAFPTLDRSIGYTLRFRVEILSETHVGNPLRAGFSVTLISDDVLSTNKSSIEIGIQSDRVFSQPGGDSPFDGSADEEAPYNPIGKGLVDYVLSVKDESYKFWADGDLLLSGDLKDYTAFIPPDEVPSPYVGPNLVFLGDNTTSAGAEIYLQQVSIENKAVPEVSGVPLLMAGSLLVLSIGLLRRRRKKLAVASLVRA